MSDQLLSLYDDVNALAQELSTRGRMALADQLKRAMYGSTSGEILSDVAGALTEARSLDAPELDELRPAMESLLRRILQMWGPVS